MSEVAFALHARWDMPLREFRDRDGVLWRVWDVSPAQVHPRSRDERLFMGYDQGWLAFESADGEMRRRLCPCPVRWEDASAQEMEALLAEAESVPARPHRAAAAPEPPGEVATEHEEEIARVSVEVRESGGEPSQVRRRPLRTFQYPGGRIWTVGVLSARDDETGDRRDVLRFVSGAHKVELEEWPEDWDRLTDPQLAELLRAGAPPRAEQPNPTEFRRRREDLHA